VKVFKIEAAPMTWEPRQGESVEVWAYNGQIPGPQIRVHQGDKVRVEFTNNIPEPSTIHFHGLNVPNAMDGVPGVTQDAVLPGEGFTYEFTVKDEPGTYMYHSHFDAAHQVDMGLLGTFVVEPKGKAPWDEEYTQVIGDGTMGYNLNGKSFPATTPMVAAKGDTVLIRLINEGGQIHPMHSHGFHMEVINEDGHALTEPYEVDTLDVSPGQRYDVLIHANKPGAWAFHCHILSHVEGSEGMYGMVTALVVK
jgi:FtsP/CotA-like multicopper oxidase with cupredoxin domain